jgi:hypothetical protein
MAIPVFDTVVSRCLLLAIASTLDMRSFPHSLAAWSVDSQWKVLVQEKQGCCTSVCADEALATALCGGTSIR